MTAPARRWSLELALVIVLPLAAVVACFITLALALRSETPPLAERVDRFGHVVEARAP